MKKLHLLLKENWREVRIIILIFYIIFDCIFKYNLKQIHFIVNFKLFSIDDAPNMEETVRNTNCELQAENQRLHTLTTSLHKLYHQMSLKVITF